MGTISAEKKGSGTYYVYRESYRVKINPQNCGKGKGSGRSKVRTRSLYLGTAEGILKSVEQTKVPSEVNIRDFGLVGGAYQTAVEIGLPEILESRRCVRWRGARAQRLPLGRDGISPLFRYSRTYR